MNLLMKRAHFSKRTAVAMFSVYLQTSGKMGLCNGSNSLLVGSVAVLYVSCVGLEARLQGQGCNWNRLCSQMEWLLGCGMLGRQAQT
jgi:hypothetical protein